MAYFVAFIYNAEYAVADIRLLQQKSSGSYDDTIHPSQVSNDSKHSTSHNIFVKGKSGGKGKGQASTRSSGKGGKGGKGSNKSSGTGGKGKGGKGKGKGYHKAPELEHTDYPTAGPSVYPSPGPSPGPSPSPSPGPSPAPTPGPTTLRPTPATDVPSAPPTCLECDDLPFLTASQSRIGVSSAAELRPLRTFSTFLLLLAAVAEFG